MLRFLVLESGLGLGVRLGLVFSVRMRFELSLRMYIDHMYVFLCRETPVTYCGSAVHEKT